MSNQPRVGPGRILTLCCSQNVPSTPNCSITNDEAAKAGRLAFRGHAHSHATGGSPDSQAWRRLFAGPDAVHAAQAPKSTRTSWTWSFTARWMTATSSSTPLSASLR